VGVRVQGQMSEQGRYAESEPFAASDSFLTFWAKLNEFHQALRCALDGGFCRDMSIEAGVGVRPCVKAVGKLEF
jgi:hypothetical protein